MASRDIEALARFREKLERELRSGLVSLLLLLTVERTGPSYGYRILSTIKESTGGQLAFKEGTAYPLLNNLEKMGLVSSYWGTGSGGPPRKYYQATALGRRALDEALDEWFGLIASVEQLITTIGTNGKSRSHVDPVRLAPPLRSKGPDAAQPEIEAPVTEQPVTEEPDTDGPAPPRPQLLDDPDQPNPPPSTPQDRNLPETDA